MERTFWGHLDVAIQLHGIHRVVVMDDRDCGAYRVFLGKNFAENASEESRIHGAQANALREKIRAKHAHLEIGLLLRSLDGSVEKIA